MLTATTMVFFAANSLLARFALRSGEIDAGSFTAVRIGAGAAALALLASVRRESSSAAGKHGSLPAAIALFSYAFTFSYAYLLLNAGTGALVLFAAVQMTMLGVGIARGERPPSSEWAGLAVAFGGLVYLALPGLAAPSTVGLLLMAVSGVAWGCYSIAAKGVRSPIAATAGNFARAVPLAAGTLIAIWGFGRPHASWLGIAVAVVSGAVTSGLGYAFWYAALKDLRTSLAAIVQLTVPVLAAAAGVVLLGEQLTWRMALASTAILGGVALALLGKIRADPTVDR
ncbi:DMT family transporter [uncultured Paludibaculum sp.]|uniref:DMT family transporter n=1 Tax=uncultured Paludibaculum sp. TaxID=1765020 RepID=UPI002AABBC3E|nr:DMT family transporter [uncultured Paludibaculum sp.]